MAKIELRLHARVMNRKQWDELDNLNFSDEVKEILGKNWLNKSDRSLIIKRTINYKGFLFINPFFEICDAIKYNVGDCLLIADYSGGSSDSGYLAEVGEISESEVGAPDKLLSSPIENIEQWLKNRGKSLSKEAITEINKFYGEESDDYWAPSNDIVELNVGGQTVRARVVSADLSEDDDEDEEEPTGFDALVNFQEMLNNADKRQKKVVTDSKYFVLTYNEGKTAKGPDYTMAIPDGFIIGKEKGRDFIAYLPEVDENGKPIKDIEQAIIRIYPGQVNELNNETDYIKSLEYYKYFGEYSYYIAKELMGALYEGKECVPVLSKYVSGAGTVDKKNTHYFYNITTYMNGNSKMFRFDVKGARKESEDIVNKMIVQLMDGIVPEEKPYTFTPVDDNKFMIKNATQKDFDAWNSNLDLLVNELNIIFTMRTSVILKKRVEMGDLTEAQFKKECKIVLKEMASRWSQLYQNVIGFIQGLSKVNNGNKILIDYYERAFNLIDGNEDLNIMVNQSNGENHLQEIICDKKTTLEKLLTSEIKDVLQAEGRSADSETLRKKREIEKRKQEIEERQRRWEEQDEADEEATEFVSYMTRQYDRYESSFQSSANRHKRMIESHSFDGPWDPELREYFEMFGDDVETFGSHVEELIQEALDKYNELNKTVSARVLIDILEEIERLIDEVNDTSIANDDLGIEHTYTWGIDVDEIQSQCSRLKDDLSDLADEQEEERERYEQEDKDFLDSLEYGVDIKDLPKHRIYLKACGLKKKAKVAKDYDDAAKEFNSIKGYLDAEKLAEECSEKSKQLKKIEQAQKEFDEASKKLETVSKEHIECEKQLQKLEQEFEASNQALVKKQSSLDTDILKIEQKRDKELEVISLELEEYQKQESMLLSQKADKENELANTFFLAFGKKKRLRDEISVLESNLSSLKKSMDKCEEKRKTAKQDATSKIKKLKDEVSKLAKDVENLNKRLSEKKEEFAKISKQKEVAQSTFNTKKEMLSSLKK